MTENTEVQVTLIEADLLNETEALTEQTNKLIVTSEMNPDIGPIIQLNTLEDIPDQVITQSINKATERTAKFTESGDHENNAEIDNVVENLLKAINKDPASNMEEEKNKIITQYYQDDEIVDLEIDDWLIMEQWGKTPASEELILVNFEDL